MAIRRYKPTTPGRRGASGSDFSRDYAKRAGEVARRAAAQPRRPERARPDHGPAPGRRAQARLPGDRLPPGRQGRRAGQGRAHRVRPEPDRADRAAALRRRREALHPGPGEPQAGRPGRERPGRRHQGRATACRCATSRPARSCTRSSCAQAAARRSPGRPGPACSCWPRRASTPRCACRRASSRQVDVNCRATVGEVSNAEQGNIKLGKAGRNRWKGKRPGVRGVAMNPINHPMGGGEGKTWGAAGTQLGARGASQRAVPGAPTGQATSSSPVGALRRSGRSTQRCHEALRRARSSTTT